MINKRQKAFGLMSEIHFVLNRQCTLKPIWTGIFASLRDWGGGQNAPPNLAISSQMMMKVGKNILWVEIFTN